jgi:DNA-binding NtrC family response regulator
MGTAVERRHRITIIDNHAEFLELMREVLSSDHDVEAFSGHDLTPDDIVDSRPDLLIVDLLLDIGDLQGWDVVTLVGAHRDLRSVPIIVCSADGRALAAHSAAIARGNMAILAKPFTLDELDQLVRRGLETGFEAEPALVAHGASAGGLAWSATEQRSASDTESAA